MRPTSHSSRRGPTAGKTMEDVPLENHRVLLPDLRPGQDYEFRLTARTRDASDITSGWTAFRSDPPPAAAGARAMAGA